MPIQFQTKAQEEIYGRVAGWMKEIFGEFAVAREDAPSFNTYVGSAFAVTAVTPWGEDDAVIMTRSWVVTKIEGNQDLYYYLLRENDIMRFGAFGLDSDNDIYFEHAIPGKSTDKDELKASVMAVILTADKYDDTITQRWGGQRAVDRK